MKVMTILGTRPEIIRLSRVMARLDETPGIDHVIVHTGQNYDHELNGIFFDDLGVREPDHFLNVSRESLGKAYGDILAKTEDVLQAERPNAVLILGDTNSAISAIIAKRMHIPVFHMEAGNRSHDENVPEEVNRKIVDHIADFNLVYTEHARRNLLAEGLQARRIHLTGSPLREVLDHQHGKIAASSASEDLDLEKGKFFLVSMHREENVDVASRLGSLVSTLERLEAEYGWPVVVSLHPRTRKRMEDFGLSLPPSLIVHPPFGFSDYCRLQRDAACVLSDSGTISEEASMLGFRAVTIRDSMERPEALEAGVIMLTGVTAEETLRSVGIAMSMDPLPPPFEYTIEDCSARTVALIAGLTGRHRAWAGLHPSPR
jgi:UDP-N-acetylglucosamine 2-epimerase (non-hydrolysing)